MSPQQKRQLEQKIHQLDHQLIKIIAARFEVSRQLQQEISFDLEDEMKMVEERAQWSLDQGVDPDLPRQIFPLIDHFLKMERE